MQSCRNFKCKQCWTPEPGNLEMSSEQHLPKMGLQMSIQASFWGILVKCSEAEGEYKDGVPWTTFPESNFMVSRCVPNLQPAPKLNLQD